MTSSFASFCWVGPATEWRQPGVMSLAWKSAATEVRHRKREIPSRVKKITQNLHILKTAIEAEKQSVDACSKLVRLFAPHRPRGTIRYVSKCFFILQ